MARITLQYIAGFFDGEGSIGIYHHGKIKQGFHLRTQLTNNQNKNTEKLMSYLVDKFGGNLSEQVTLSGKTRYNWQLNSDKAIFFLRKIEPYLILKKDQAIIVINWQEQRPERVRDDRGRIQVKRKRTINFDIKVARLIKALKEENLDVIIKRQGDFFNIIKELMPLAATKENKKFAKKGIEKNNLFYN